MDDQNFSMRINFSVGESQFMYGCKNVEREIQEELEKASTEILNLGREIKKLEKELSQPNKIESKQPKKDTNQSLKREEKEEKKEENHE